MRRLAEITFLVLTLSALVMTQTGCSSFGKKLKALVGGGGDSSEEAKRRRPVSFNSQPQMGSSNANRQYKRVTKENFFDDQGLEEHAGSLWRKEGQGAFLFTQNNLRNLGDIVNVKIEDRTAQDLTIKADVIRQILVAKEKPMVRRRPASPVGAIPKPAADKEEDGQQQGQSQEQQAEGKAKGQPNEKFTKSAKGADKFKEREPDQEVDGKKDEKREEIKFDVAEVAARITERYGDGSYRIKGMQTFMISKKEYKVMVTGLVKPEDINDGTVSSVKVLDSKFDIIPSSNKDRRL